MTTLEATPSTTTAPVFKIAPPTAQSTCNFQGTIVNQTGSDLVLQQSNGGNGWDTQPPARIASGETGSFSNSSATTANGNVQYANAQGVSVYVSWSVPWIGTNDIGSNTYPNGIFYVAQSGGTGGYSPSVTWTVSLA